MSDGVWMSVSEAAQAKGVSKQAISKRLHGLASQVSTRRDGQKLLLNIVEYDRVTSDNTDPAQALRNRDLPERSAATDQAQPRPENIASRVFSQQRARRESYEAENARLDLEERMGKLLRVTDVEDAMVRCASAIVRVIDQLPGKSDDPAIRKILKAAAVEMRASVAQEMRMLGAGADPAEAGQ